MLTLTKANLTKNRALLPRQEFVVSGHQTMTVQGQERPRFIVRERQRGTDQWEAICFSTGYSASIVSIQDTLEECVRELEQAVPQIINNIKHVQTALASVEVNDESVSGQGCRNYRL
jgi:hypothetical protein